MIVVQLISISISYLILVKSFISFFFFFLIYILFFIFYFLL